MNNKAKTILLCVIGAIVCGAIAFGIAVCVQSTIEDNAAIVTDKDIKLSVSDPLTINEGNGKYSNSVAVTFLGGDDIRGTLTNIKVSIGDRPATPKDFIAVYDTGNTVTFKTEATNEKAFYADNEKRRVIVTAYFGNVKQICCDEELLFPAIK